MPWRPLVIFRCEEVDNDCSDDNSNRKDDICDYVDVGSFEINISFVLLMMSFNFLLRLMAAKESVLNRDRLFCNSMSTTGHYLLTAFMLMRRFLTMFMWATGMTFLVMVMLLLGRVTVMVVILVLVLMLMIVMLMSVAMVTWFFDCDLWNIRICFWYLSQR